MHTAGSVTQNKPNPDLEILLYAVQAISLTGGGVVPSPAVSYGAIGGTGPLGAIITGNAITAILAFVPNLLLRTGVFASQALGAASEAFGTALATPGPNQAVPATSSPSGFGVNSVVPPILKANLSTLIGSVAGAIAKGIQINWIDFIYQIATTPPTAIAAILAATSIAVGVDVTPTLVMTPATTAFATAAKALNTAGNFHRTRVTLATPIMWTADATVPSIQLEVITAATGTVSVLGAVLGCSYNFN